METLYFIGRAQFHQLATHIALYHEDSTPGYRELGAQSLREAGLQPARFAFWNVPRMGYYLGKAIPLDIHGGHVLVDETAAMAMAGSYGMLRYAYLAAAVRVREGGRWRYDFTTMNATLGLGVGAGGALLYCGRRRPWRWMYRRPVAALSASLVVCFVAMLCARATLRGLGLGIVQAQHTHRKALDKLRCVDCLDDISGATTQQIADLAQQKLPQQPGMPPPPEELVRRFTRGLQTQRELLTLDVQEMRQLTRRLGPQALCELHRGLRDDPAHYHEPHGLPLLERDRTRAAERAGQAASAAASEEIRTSAT